MKNFKIGQRVTVSGCFGSIVAGSICLGENNFVYFVYLVEMDQPIYSAELSCLMKVIAVNEKLILSA